MNTPTPESKWETLNPELASYFLTLNTENRPLREIQVERLARDMSLGRYVPNHQGVAFNIDGKMVDGQHRCHAIIKSGATVPMLVTYGLPVEAREVVDIGARRKVSDFLEGPSVTLRTASARALATLDLIEGDRVNVTQYGSYARQVTDSDVREVLTEEDRGERLLRFLSKARMAHRHVDGVGPSPILAAAVWHHEVADHFLDELVSGAGLEIGNPALALRNFRPPRRVHNHFAVLLCMKAISQMARGRAIRRLSLRNDEEIRL